MYANLPAATELRESSYRWIGKQLGMALLGEGVAAANVEEIFAGLLSLGKELLRISWAQLVTCCGLSMCSGSGQVITI